MQRLINAIDKATRAGVYTLEETANILQAIDQVGAVVKNHNERQEAAKKMQEAAKNLQAQKELEDKKVHEGPSKDESKLEKA
jgi:hypothetical protein